MASLYLLSGFSLFHESETNPKGFTPSPSVHRSVHRFSHFLSEIIDTMKGTNGWAILLSMGILFALVLSYVFHHIQFTKNVMNRMEVEAFHNRAAPLEEQSDKDADADLQNPYRTVDLFDRKNDLLLSNHGETRRSQIGMTAQQCMSEDIQNNLLPVGSYRQLTNNYKRELPDNCSMWNKDLSPFYTM